MQIRSRTLPPALPPRTRTLLPRTRTLPPTLPGRRKIDRSSRPEYQKLIDGDSIYTCTNFTSEREGGGKPGEAAGRQRSTSTSKKDSMPLSPELMRMVLLGRTTRTTWMS